MVRLALTAVMMAMTVMTAMMVMTVKATRLVIERAR